jgi:hypothetical protein
MAKYEATRTEQSGVVGVVDGKPLDPRNDLFNHSPDGFEMGYGGSGPSQLSLAILAHHFRAKMKNRAAADELAVRFHQHFKALEIARAEGDYFTIDTDGIEAALAKISERRTVDRA